jgi:DNA-binding MarR family transcriptional regulator
MTPEAARQELAAQAWRAILDFITATASQRTRILADLGLTVSDSRALTALDAQRGRSMRSLAEEWSCDASTATWIVDRLEQRGLAERRPDPDDRRLRLAQLTVAGARLREELLRRMYTPPPELLALDESDLSLLGAAAAKLRSGSTASGT